MNPHTYGHLVIGKGAKTIYWKEDRIFNKWCWLNWHLACRRMRIDPFLFPCTKLVLVDQGTPYKTRDTETYRGENGEES